MKTYKKLNERSYHFEDACFLLKPTAYTHWNTTTGTINLPHGCLTLPLDVRVRTAVMGIRFFGRWFVDKWLQADGTLGCPKFEVLTEGYVMYISYSYYFSILYLCCVVYIYIHMHS